MNPTVKRRIIVVAAAAFLVFAGTTIPLPQVYHFPCVLSPATVVSFANQGSGQLALLCSRNYLANSVDQKLYQFERPDVVEVVTRPQLVANNSVDRDDTLLFIVSRSEQGKQSVIRAELDRARAKWNALASGSRPEDLEVEKNVCRQQKLHWRVSRHNTSEQKLSTIQTLFLSRNTRKQKASIISSWPHVMWKKPYFPRCNME